MDIHQLDVCTDGKGVNSNSNLAKTQNYIGRFGWKHTLLANQII